MAKIGRPSKYNPEFHPKDLIARAENGESITECCAAWSISRELFYQWCQKHDAFLDAFKIADPKRHAWWMNLGKAAMLGSATYAGKPVKISLGFYIWLTKNMLNWSDKVKIEDPAIKEEYSRPDSMIIDEPEDKT